MNPVRRNLLICLLVFLGPMLAPRPAEAQATFQTSVAASTVTTTGHTELTGDITFTVTAGTSVAGRLDISYPVPFANDASTGITVTGTGALSGATVAAAASSGIAIVNIPAGAGVGATVSLRGVRFSAAANNTVTMNATLSSTGNFITAGQVNVRVVNTSAPGFTLISVPGPSFSLANGAIVTGAPDLQIIEGYESSFTSAVGQLGQTVPTQVIFRVIGLPDNVSLTFPATVSSASGATLSTGVPVVLTNQSTTNLVVYSFGASATSQSSLDEFTVTPVIGATAPSGTGTAFIQVSLGPIGAAVPTASLPSTAIPRFSEDFLPPLSSIPGATVSLTFAISQLETDENIAISNLGTGAAGLIFRATRSDGSSSMSSASPILPARGTSIFSLPQLFGTMGSTASLSAIQVESLNNRLIGTSIVSAPGGRTTTTAATAELYQFILPLNLTSSTRDATITIINSRASTADVTLILRSAGGQIISSTVRQVPNGATFRDGLLSLFSVPAASVPANAYVDGTSTVPVRVSAFANPLGPVERIQGLDTLGIRYYRYPYFVTGGGYGSVLTLVNRSFFPVQVTLTPIQTNGAFFSGIGSTVRVIGSLERADIDLSTVVPATSSLTAGSLFMRVDRSDDPNPFSTPQMAGTIRTRTASSSTVIPLFTERLTEAFITPALEDNTTTYTGVAFLNDSGSDITVTVDIFSAAGTLIGSKVFVLASQNVRAQLLRELVPASLGQGETLVRINATQPIGIVGFRGGLNSSELLYLHPQQ